MQYQPKPLDAGDVARALLDSSAPATDPAVQLLQVAMSGFGYNFYDARNVARANDQLVRGRANDVLGTAAATLGKLEKSYKARAFPEATREQPLPPPDRRAAQTRRSAGIGDRRGGDACDRHDLVSLSRRALAACGTRRLRHRAGVRQRSDRAGRGLGLARNG
jgi:hypothetical protein